MGPPLRTRHTFSEIKTFSTQKDRYSQLMPSDRGQRTVPCSDRGEQPGKAGTLHPVPVCQEYCCPRCKTHLSHQHPSLHEGACRFPSRAWTFLWAQLLRSYTRRTEMLVLFVWEIQKRFSAPARNLRTSMHKEAGRVRQNSEPTSWRTKPLSATAHYAHGETCTHGLHEAHGVETLNEFITLCWYFNYSITALSKVCILQRHYLC